MSVYDNIDVLRHISNAPPDVIGHSCMKLINALAACPKELRPAVVAVMFAMICKTYKVAPSAAWEVANNIVDDALNAAPELRAAALYIVNQT